MTCSEAVERIFSVVEPESTVQRKLDDAHINDAGKPQEVSSLSCATLRTFSPCDQHPNQIEHPKQVKGGMEILARMYATNETFREQIRAERMQKHISEVRPKQEALSRWTCKTGAPDLGLMRVPELEACASAQVEAAGDRLEEHLDAMLNAALAVWQQHDSLPALKPTLVYDVANNAVWLKAVHRSQVWHCAMHASSLPPCLTDLQWMRPFGCSRRAAAPHHITLKQGTLRHARHRSASRHRKILKATCPMRIGVQDGGKLRAGAPAGPLRGSRGRPLLHGGPGGRAGGVPQRLRARRR